jgi:hypothetical protein
MILMRKSLLSALLAGAAGLSWSSVADALPLVGPQLTARLVNGEFRGYTQTQRGFENQIWHFLPDGRIRAVADARRQVWRNRDDYLQWQDIGAWRVEGDRVCVTFDGLNRTLAGCYSVDAGYGIQVRLVGPYVWQGTLGPHE